MNNSGMYLIVSAKKRRKHIVAVETNPAANEQDFKCDRDEKGLLLLDLSLLEDGIVAQGLLLSGEDLANIIKESYCRKAKSRAIWYLSSADHSKKGLKRKLMRYFPEYAAESAVNRMEELGYIDDEKFARSACEVYAAKGMSESAIVSKLISQGVDSSLAKNCVADSSNNPAEQIELIINKHYARKLQNPENLPKVVAALARRGFKFSDIKSVLKNYTETEIDEEC